MTGAPARSSSRRAQWERSSAGTLGSRGAPRWAPGRTIPSAFLFSLTNSFRHGLIGNSASALWDVPSAGPQFGAGPDFKTNLKDQVSSALGYSYVCRVGAGTTACATDYLGMATPVLVEFEVYAAP